MWKVHQDSLSAKDEESKKDNNSIYKSLSSLRDEEQDESYKDDIDTYSDQRASEGLLGYDRNTINPADITLIKSKSMMNTEFTQPNFNKNVYYNAQKYKAYKEFKDWKSKFRLNKMIKL